MRKLKLFWRAFLTVLREGDPWTHSDMEWGEQDALNLNHFLSNSTGQRMQARFRFTSLEHNRTAVQDGTKHRCGVATGYMLCLTELQILSQGPITEIVEPIEDEKEVASIGEADGLAHLSP